MSVDHSSSLSAGHQCVDSDHGHPDPGVGDAAGRGLVDVAEIPRVCLGQGALERHWSLRQREDSPYSTGRVEGCQNGEGWLRSSIHYTLVCVITRQQNYDNPYSCVNFYILSCPSYYVLCAVLLQFNGHTGI